MSLIRNSLLVALGTTVAGIGLMELFSSKPSRHQNLHGIIEQLCLQGLQVEWVTL